MDESSFLEKIRNFDALYTVLSQFVRLFYPNLDKCATGKDELCGKHREKSFPVYKLDMGTVEFVKKYKNSTDILSILRKQKMDVVVGICRSC